VKVVIPVPEQGLAVEDDELEHPSQRSFLKV
jgi:hypothetical protein